jgi:para-nitrobenzyl esterase
MQPGAGEVDEAGLAARLAPTMPDARVRIGAIEAYRAARDARGQDVSPPELLAAISTDQMFRHHSTRVGEAQAAHQPRTYMYLFTWKSPMFGGRLGSCHALEIPFVFGTFDGPLGGLVGEGAEALGERMQEAWLAFARADDPSHAGLPAWPAYDAAERATMLLGPECRVERAPYEPERRCWEATVAAMAEAARA